jgi:cytochrome b
MDADEPVNPQKQAARPVLVWDVPTRLFHWLVVVLVAAAYATSKLNWMDWHVRIGETLLALVLFRLLHLRHLFRREADVQVGHNSAGGWMVLLLLVLLLGETLSGLYVNNDIADDGPLTQWVPASIANAITALHTILWDALLAAVALHVLAIAVYAVAKGHNLLRPMLTGRKRLPERIRAPRQASVMLALLLLVISATLVTLLATYL